MGSQHDGCRSAGDLERLARRDFRAARRCGIEAPGVPAPQGRAPPGADHASRSRYPAVVQAVADILDDVSGVPVRGDRKVDEKARGQTLAATQPAAIRGGSLRRRRGGRRTPYVRIGRRTAPCFQSEVPGRQAPASDSRAASQDAHCTEYPYESVRARSASSTRRGQRSRQFQRPHRRHAPLELPELAKLKARRPVRTAYQCTNIQLGPVAGGRSIPRCRAARGMTKCGASW